MLAGWRQGAQADQALQGSCRSCAAGADTDHALQGLIWIRRCRGSCRSGAAGAHADQALRGPMKTRRCRRSCSSGAAGPAALLHVKHCVSVNIKPRSLASTFRSAALAVRPLNLGLPEFDFAGQGMRGGPPIYCYGFDFIFWPPKRAPLAGPKATQSERFYIIKLLIARVPSQTRHWQN